jgi:hypothetical protein
MDFQELTIGFFFVDSCDDLLWNIQVC